MLEKIEGRRRRGQQRMRWLNGITNSMDVSLSKRGVIEKAEKPGMLQFMGSQRIGHDLVTEQQQSLVTEQPQSLGWDKKARGALGEESFPPVD